MKLPPFGIRELYDSKTGTLHISKPQYDSTIRSYPDAVLSYVDDEDGEVITVGSGLELEQRLGEPVRPFRRRRPSIERSSSRRGSMDDSMIHLFDIQRTQDNLAIWMEHEAYSSKTLRSIRSSSAVSDIDDDEMLPPQQSEADDAVSPLSEPQPALILDEPVREAEMEAEAQPQQPAEDQAQPSVETTPRPAPSSEFMQDLDNVLSAACKGLEAFGLADILDGTAQAFQSMAQKTRDADTSPVDGLLEGIKDVVTEFGRFGLDLLENLENAPALEASDTQPSTDRTTETVTCNCAQKGAAKKAREEDKLARREARLAVKEQRREEKRARRVERLAQREERRASKKGKAPEATESEQHEDFYRSAPPAPSEEVLPALAPEPRKRVSFADLQEEIRAEFDPPRVAEPSLTSFQRALNTLTADEAELVEYPTLKAIPTAPTKQDPVQGPPTLSAPFMPYQSFPNRPGPAFPAFTPKTKPPTNATSIMDLETSNAEFTARYPPLMSLRRAKTVNELHKKAGPATADNSATTTKAALTRYPSIGQLEAQRRVTEDPRKAQVLTMQADMLRRRERQKAEPSSHFYRAPSVEEDDGAPIASGPLFANAERRDLASSVTKPLPGSWPEPRQDESHLSPANESSGAFFNRMAGIKDSSPVAPRAVSPALSCRTTSPPEDPYFPPTGLRRAQTVTASNPAARLTRPFDPLSNAPRLEPSRQQPSAGPLPQRSSTVQHPRRPEPNSTRSTVGGPSTLWSNFPRSAQVPMIQPPQPPAVQQIRPPHFPRPIWPNTSNTSASVNPPNHFPRHMRSEPNFHYPAPTPQRSGRNGFFPPSSISKVDECIKTLRAMGYGMNDPNEGARLSVYAGAAAGDVLEAIDMIEEDREAAQAIKNGTATIRVL